MLRKNENIRNIAIIAHVDHGKTTLVDALFRQSGVLLKDENEERIMDSGDIERERGITISAKNCAINYKGVKINIIDTPGHADFGGEVERGLSMVDGVVLLVDSAEGPLPQTRFVLEKALNLKLPVIVVLNKLDRIDSRPEEVLNEVYELLLELTGDDESVFDVPVFYANGRKGFCGLTPDHLENDMHLLLDKIVSYLPSPVYDDDEPFQMLVSDLSYSDFLGRLAIGKVINGKASMNDSLVCIKEDGMENLRVTRLATYTGPKFNEVKSVDPGDIIVLSGVNDVSIGDTICTKDELKALPRIKVDEPTVSMMFCQNTSPLAGKEGDAVTGAKIWERLQKEALKNVSIRIEKNKGDTFTVKGRGEFQMAIIVEEMRRDGFELSVGRPQIIFKSDENGNKTEPIEELYIDCPEDCSGVVMEKLGKRKATLIDMNYIRGNRVKIKFEIPTRGLIGYRDEFLTDTKGMGVMNTLLKGYEKYRGDFPDRQSGSLVCDRDGCAVAYGLWELEDRGRFFIIPGDPVYEGEVVGERNKEIDLLLNPTRTKKLTNLRAAGKDEAVTLTPVVKPSLEEAIQFIKDDELVEVTPKSIRMRKKILNSQQRKIYNSRGEIPHYLH